MKTMTTRTIFLLLLLGTSVAGFAEGKKTAIFPDFTGGTFGVYGDNDIFTGTDQDYTSGVRLSWLSDYSSNSNSVPAFQYHANRLSEALASNRFTSSLWGLDHQQGVDYRYGVGLTQQIFTPEVFDGPRPLDERPYAGWLGLGLSVHISDKNVVNSITGSIGVVGPASLAEETQDFIHRVIDTDLFDDWDSQIPNELTFDLTFSQKRRFHYFSEEDFALFPFALNGSTEVALSLGSRLTAATLGWHFQLGYNLPEGFSDSKLSPTSNSLSWDIDPSQSNLSCFLVAGIEGKAVLHDITLDGPVFRSFDTNASSQPFTFDFYYGAAVRYKSCEFIYTQTIRTKEYTSQANSQRFGSLAFRIHY